MIHLQRSTFDELTGDKYTIRWTWNLAEGSMRDNGGLIASHELDLMLENMLIR